MFETWNVLTFKRFSFKNDAGELVEGVTLHCYRVNHENGWPGVEYGKFSISKQNSLYNRYDPACGDVINIGFNRYGKPSSIERVG